MTSTDLEQRLALLKRRLHSAYDGIGHSYGRPYVYFVYPPENERQLRHLIAAELYDSNDLVFHHIDILPLVLQATEGEEMRREELLADAVKGASAAASLLKRWTRVITRAITARLQQQAQPGRPVVVLSGMAALHPLGTPTTMMEVMADDELRSPATNEIVPIVLFVPGIRPPQSNRLYWFLGQERLHQTFYRGEEA